MPRTSQRFLLCALVGLLAVGQLVTPSNAVGLRARPKNQPPAHHSATRLHVDWNGTDIPFRPKGLTGTVVVNCTGAAGKVVAVVCQGESLVMDVRAVPCPAGEPGCDRKLLTQVACEAPSSMAPERSNGVPTSAEEAGQKRQIECTDEPIASDCQPGRHPVCEYFDENGEKQVVLPGPDPALL